MKNTLRNRELAPRLFGDHNVRLLILLISLWLSSQLFYYEYINDKVVWKYFVTLSPTRFLFIAIVVVFFFQVVNGKIKLSQIVNIEICMVLFTLICTLSLISSKADYGNEKYGHWTTLINTTYAPFIIYYIVKNIPYSRRTIRKILIVFCLMGFYLSLTGIFEHYRIDTLIWPKYILDRTLGTQFGRARGPFIQSVAMGRVLSLTLLCMLLMTLYYKGLYRTLLCLLSILAGVALYFTYTRGPWIACALSLLVFAMFNSKFRKYVFLCILLGLMSYFLGIGSKMSFKEDNTLFSQRQNTTSYRIATWVGSTIIISSNPIFGVGYGNFSKEWDSYCSNIKGYSIDYFDGNHNAFLGMMVEVGMVGFFFFGAIYYLLIKKCLRIYKKTNNANNFENQIVVLVIAVTVMFLITGMFSDLRHHSLPPAIQFLFFGIIACLDKRLSVN